ASLALLLIATATDVSAKTKKADRSDGRLNDQISLLNLIGAAESAYFQGQSRYADFEELVRSGQIQESSEQRPEYSKIMARSNLRSDLPLLGDFKLTLTVSPNSDGYHVYLIQQGKECGAGWFTDESGAVYGGKEVTCGEGFTASWAPLNVDAELPAVQDGSQCPLSQILQETSARASELVENLQRF